jgi:hypothetical protein
VGDGPALRVFAVDALHEGTAYPQQEVVFPDSGSSCGLGLSGDGPFLVLATVAAGGGLAAYLCGGSAPLTPELEAEVQAVVALPEGLPLAHQETPAPGSLGAQAPVGMEAAELAQRVRELRAE